MINLAFVFVKYSKEESGSWKGLEHIPCLVAALTVISVTNVNVCSQSVAYTYILYVTNVSMCIINKYMKYSTCSDRIRT